MHWINWIILGIAVVLTGAGGLAILYQLFNGLNRTGLNDRYVWGLNIQGFFTLSSYAAGILTIISAWILMGLPDPGGIFVPAGTLAFGFLISSQILLGSDLGRPLRALYILKGRNFVSPLTWDFVTLMILTVCSFFLMFNLVPQNEFFVKGWALVTLLASLLCIVVHTIFFIPKVEAGYNSHPFSSLDIFAGSIWSGAAVMVLMSTGLDLQKTFLGFLLVFSIIVFASSAGAFIASKLGRTEHKNVKFLVINGVIILGLVAENLVLKEGLFAGSIIAVLVLFAVFIEKYDLVTEYQGKPSLPLPYSMFEKIAPYKPSVFELGSLVACFSLSVVIFYAVYIFKLYILPFVLSWF